MSSSEFFLVELGLLLLDLQMRLPLLPEKKPIAGAIMPHSETSFRADPPNRVSPSRNNWIVEETPAEGGMIIVGAEDMIDGMRRASGKDWAKS